MNREANERVVFFDGDCGFCNRWVLFVLKKDSKKLFRFASLQSEVANRCFKERNEPELADGKSLVLLESGRFFVKSTAVLKILREVDGFWRFAYLFMACPAPLRDFVYSVFARWRHVLGSKKYCAIPPPDVVNRFLAQTIDS